MFSYQLVCGSCGLGIYRGWGWIQSVLVGWLGCVGGFRVIMVYFYYDQLNIYINTMLQAQQKIIQNLRDRIQQVNQLVHLRKFEDICTQSKILSVDFMYFTKFIKYVLPGWENTLSLITQFADSISKIITYTQYTKYGQQLPLMYTAYKKYKQSLSTIFPNLINQPETYKKSSIYQTSLIFESLRQHEILNTQLQFLQSKKCTEFFFGLSNQQIYLQNQQCVCCSQVFIKKLKIINNNPFISVISQINSKEAFDHNNLQNYITAVCNKGGGIIVIGANIENGSLIATGIRFKNMQQMNQKEIQMQKAIMNVRNIKQYRIEKVMVHTNYVQPKNIKNQYFRICFRIFINPAEPRKISYLQSFRLGFHKVYSSYQFDQNLIPKKIMTDPSNSNSPGIYKKIHEKYNRFKPRKNSHENIQCFRPHCHNSNLFLKQVHLHGYSSQESSSDEKMKFDAEKQLKFKYQNTSLIVIASQKQEKRIIDDLTVAFNERKIVHEWHKPYERDFKQGRSVWMLSHDRKFTIIKDLWRMVMNQYKEKTKGANVLMPVFKTLQIDRLMLSEQHLAYIHNKVLKNFEEQIKVGVVKKYVGKQQKDLTYLQFGCMSQSIYAYKVFEELGLAPYFTEETNC